MRRLPPIVLAGLLGAVLARAAPALVPSVEADAPPSGPTDFSAVAARVEPGVVHIVNYLQVPRAVPDPGEPAAEGDTMGAGFVWQADGWILTNRHVTAGSKRILVEVKDRGWFPARLVGTDPVVDVAVLKIDATGLSPVAIGDPRSLKVGQWVVAGGSPYRLARSMSVGVVSGLSRSEVGVNPEGYEDFVQTDAAINLGNSGGPLFDASGRVVGMNTAILSRTTGNQGIAFATPIDVVIRAAEMLKSTGRVVRTTIGAVVRAVPPEASSGLPGGGGVEVTRLLDDSPARRAGLRPGDVILSADGAPTRSRGALQRAVWSKAGGARLPVTLWRSGEVLEATVTVSETSTTSR